MRGYKPFALLAALLLLIGGSPLWSQSDVKLFPLSEVRPGMKGVGRTVFEGDQIQEFQVEILGVVKNAVAPKQDLILARLTGGPLEKTGVIAGMSGSPVYIDGRLVGAVARSFPFSKDSIAGITPIEQMLRVVPSKKMEAKEGDSGDESTTWGAKTTSSGSQHTLPNSISWSRVAESEAVWGYRLVREPAAGNEGYDYRLIPTQANEAPPWSKLIASDPQAEGPNALSLPLHFGGISSQAIQSFAGVFRALGFEPMSGGIVSGSGQSDEQKSLADAGEIKPGSMISLFLVRGDLNLNADCTVTYIDANNLYACGHQLLLGGPSQIPFGRSHVLAVIPSIASSFKVDAPGPPVGSIRQDRFGAVYGVVGAPVVSMPVHVRVKSTLNTQADYNFELVEDPFLTPFFMNIALLSTLGSTERMLGPTTLEVKGKIKLSSGDSIDIEDVNSSEVNSATAVGLAVTNPLGVILSSGFPDLKVEGIDLSVLSLNELHIVNLQEAWTTKSEVRPGDHIEVTALLRTPSGENVIRRIPVDIPESVTDKTLTLAIGSGTTINALQNRLAVLSAPPRDVHQLVRALNRIRRNNRLYALLMSPQRSFVLQGDEYPSPPPSLVQTLLADPAFSGNVTFSGTSVVGDFETKPAPYTIRGEKTIVLKVLNAGS